MTFEQWFKSHYIKTGFVHSKAEMETAWQACAEHYEAVMRRAVDAAFVFGSRWSRGEKGPTSSTYVYVHGRLDDIITRAREGK